MVQEVLSILNFIQKRNAKGAALRREQNIRRNVRGAEANLATLLKTGPGSGLGEEAPGFVGPLEPLQVRQDKQNQAVEGAAVDLVTAREGTGLGQGLLDIAREKLKPTGTIQGIEATILQQGLVNPSSLNKAQKTIFDRLVKKEERDLNLRGKKADVLRKEFDINSKSQEQEILKRTLINRKLDREIDLLDTKIAGATGKKKVNLEKSKFTLSLTQAYEGNKNIQRFDVKNGNFGNIVSAFKESRRPKKKGSKKLGTQSITDQAMITSFNKITDADSVVRESEFARSQQGQSIINRMRGALAQKIAGGQGLSDEERVSIVRVSALLIQSSREGMQPVIDTFTKQAKNANVNPKDAFRPFVVENVQETMKGLGIDFSPFSIGQGGDGKDLSINGEPVPKGAELIQDKQTVDGQPVYRLPSGQLWTP